MPTLLDAMASVLTQSGHTDDTFARACRRVAAITPDDALALACVAPEGIDDTVVENQALDDERTLRPKPTETEWLAIRAASLISDVVLDTTFGPGPTRGTATIARTLAYRVIWRGLGALLAQQPQDARTRLLDPFCRALGFVP